MGSRQPEDGVTQPLTFLVAGAIFVLSVGAVLLASPDRVHGDAAQQASLDREARSLVDLLAFSPGVVGQAGAPERLGLQSEDGGLDAEKLRALEGAALAADAGNGLVDYEESLASLGLGEGRDMHLRIHPVAGFEADLSDVRLAYVGHYPPTPPLPPVPEDDPEPLVDGFRASYEPQTGVLEEILLLQNLGMRFDAELNLNTSSLGNMVLLSLGIPVALDLFLGPEAEMLEGDVLMDDSDYLASVLPPVLERVDVLFVGSLVEQEALAAQGLPFVLAAWVQAGGTIVTLGSFDADTDWLQPLFDMGRTTANQAVSEPDPDHPVFQAPNPLAPTSFQGGTNSMQFPPDAWPLFDHVLLKYGTASKLAVSREGAFGSGSVIVSSYIPSYILVSEYQAPEEGQATVQRSSEPEEFFENLVTFPEYRDLFLDYGKQAPEAGGTGLAQRTTFLEDPEAGHVPMVVTVRTWAT